MWKLTKANLENKNTIKVDWSKDSGWWWSMKEGDVPLDWKTANIMPVFKKGSRICLENYRPVSLTSLLSKVMESLVRDEIVRHLDKHHLITDSARLPTWQILYL